ncbi:ABC transporter ATP-binding protein [Salinactinospora qingdaonensis]|uniref:Spermidine/putrescine import ATP-binding protein PotA n=1 Tax=Salinactinospora qingdaonensis TaxID=702744 RepID=A0ABP7G074_9ACTN
MATTGEQPSPSRTTDAAPSATPPAIGLEHLTKIYRSRAGVVTAVRGVDLAVERGEFLSLLGPSGCGKTTVLRLVAGFETPTSGTVRLAGAEVTDRPPHRRDVNMVFQSYALFPHMTVVDNVAFGLQRKRLARAEVKRRVREMLDLVELDAWAGHKPGHLSGGQQQRVALARALVNRPSALLLDEPLGALDRNLRQTMGTELTRIQRELGLTFVHVTHDQSEALALSDRIAVMNAGTVEQLAPPAEIYERPATAFVAGFLGTSNLLAGVVADREGVEHALLDIGAGRRLRVRSHAPEGARLHVTIRPEKISLSTTEPDTATDRLSGTVREIVYLGASTHYTVDVGQGTEIVAHRQNTANAGNIAERGDTVWLSWRGEHAYVLPR